MNNDAENIEPLNHNEKTILKLHKILIKDLISYTSQKLSNITEITHQRCKIIIAYATFTNLHSIGVNSARDIIRLKIYTMDKLKISDPYKMYKRLNKLTQTTVDPCVEDVFRCAVAQAKYGNRLPKKYTRWWSWMPLRGKNVVIIPKN